MLQHASKEKKIFTCFFIVTAVISFFVIALRSWLVPFNHDETATFFFFIQPGNYMPFYSDVDANNHILNSFLSNICFHLFGSSPFALRLPNLFGFIILILATHKISEKVEQLGSKLFITTALLFSFHWLSFFSACRGYGLSMALLTMGITTFFDCINDSSNKKVFIVTLLLFQLAISANLILIIVVLLLSSILIVVQFTNKTLFSISNLFIWFLHFAAIYYWLSFSFYLQDKGALYYGAGNSYWQVTFVTLIQLVVGFANSTTQYGIIIFFIITLLLTAYVNKSHLQKLFNQFKKPTISILIAAVLVVLIFAFYIMHKLMNVNYPEDRTGLFFYLLFVLLIGFTFDKLPGKINAVVLFIISIGFIIHFIFNLNFRKHSLYVYETIPQHFYDTLVQEQNKSTERITIGGHRVRELFYDFLNYRNDGYLNPEDAPETMQMNCDYYISTKAEEKYYKNYYDVIDTEPDWGFLVLKRKEKIKRIQLAEVKDKKIETNDAEFMEIYRSLDTTSNLKPLLAEFNFDIEQIPVPNNVWIVFQINDSTGQASYYKRYPLSWSGYDNNQRKGLSYGLTSGNLPKGPKTIVCYFWNIKKEPFIIKVNSLKIHQLDAKGVDFVAPDTQ